MADRGLFTNLTFRADRWENGAKAGYMDAFNVSEMQITQPDPDTKTRVSYMAESYGQALGAISTPKPATIQFKTDSLPPAYLSMALLGVPADYTQTVAAAVESTFVAITNKWVPLARVELTAFAIAGKTLGVDYEVHLAGGLVKVLGSPGTIVNGSTVTYTHSAPARAGSKIVAGTQSLIQLTLHGSGINADTGKRCGILVHKANVSPSGALSFIGADYISMTFKGTLIKPDDQDGSWEYWEFES
ncbi:MAG: hypothetical protein MUC53_00940 [Candidatus Contendobacter sp.]|jgi:hypothetical protein|nr:hypothetical protein [Candidatus Contendobacter sp.]